MTHFSFNFDPELFEYESDWDDVVRGRGKSSCFCNSRPFRCPTCAEKSTQDFNEYANPFLFKETAFEEVENEESLDTKNLGLQWERKFHPNNPRYIRWVQHSLNKLLGPHLKVDGILGSATRRAIKRFQQRHGLRIDGIVGGKTEAALTAAGAPPPPSQGIGILPSPVVSPGLIPTNSGARAVSCPESSRLAKDRCLNPGSKTCPAIPNLLCQTHVDNIPFEYPTQIQRTPQGGLYLVKNRIQSRRQRFIPRVRDALSLFVKNMGRFGMPIEALLTAGSLYCRCIRNSNSLSNHSFGDAIDIVGVRWPPVGGPASRLPETIVHNYTDPGERILLIRINACLRLSFPTVIDYHRNDHRDHFHCDMNQGGGWNPRSSSTLRFVQECLSLVLRKQIPITGKFDSATRQGLLDFSGLGPESLLSSSSLKLLHDQLFTRIAQGLKNEGSFPNSI